ncbi:MAG: hypothetical protein GXP55_18940 [Deltaproteobacteria bacterium]|nr:hypothetical protein [Deltaproteobacteria bacterium]
MSKRLEMLESMIAKGSEDPFVHYARGLELRSLERLAEASTALDAVMERFPDYVPSYLMAGQIEQSLGHPERAAERYRRGVEVAREAGDAHAVGELGVALDALDL